MLDLTSVIMGPYATQLLGDYGADVIKIEPPDGDVMRRAGPMRSKDMGHFYLTTNRSKRSVVIDLKQPAGRAALLRLAATVDVLVYNLRPQAMVRLGLSYEDLAAVNPSIVYVGAFGFSQRGPYAAKPAYDDLIQGMSGIPWLGMQSGADKPRYAPMVLVDRMAGLQLATAILGALFHRERTGEGQRVDVPMFEGMASIVMGEHLAGKLFDPPIGPIGYQRSLAVDRRPLETLDSHICVMVYSDKQWKTFLELVGHGEKFKGEVRFSSQSLRLENIESVNAFLRDMLKTRTTDEWLAALGAADIPCSKMNSLDDILDDEHLKAIGFFRNVEHPSEGAMQDTSIPTEWSATPPTVDRLAPTLGQHTVEVLREAGFTPEDIDVLVGRSAVGGPGR